LKRLKVRAMIRRMATVFFTPQLQRFTATPEVQTRAATLREALEAAFGINPQLRGYVLDEQEHLRANVVVFIDGRRVGDRVALNDALRPDSRVHVLQALSGG
jgi:sulfur-carrier protein